MELKANGVECDLLHIFSVSESLLGFSVTAGYTRLRNLRQIFTNDELAFP